MCWSLELRINQDSHALFLFVVIHHSVLNGLGAPSDGNGLLDAILSAEEVGVYKPYPKVYSLVVGRPGVSDCLSVIQCLGCLCGLGLRHAGRVLQPNGQRREGLPGAPEREVRSLLDLPALFDAQM